MGLSQTQRAGILKDVFGEEAIVGVNALLSETNENLVKMQNNILGAENNYA